MIEPGQVCEARVIDERAQRGSLKTSTDRPARWVMREGAKAEQFEATAFRSDPGHSVEYGCVAFLPFERQRNEDHQWQRGHK
jgi:hypothetical protein